MNIWRNLSARKKLIDTFKSAGLYLTFGENRVYPKIHSVKSTERATEYVFTLPNGLDPALIKKNYFAFVQHFGKSIELDGEYKRYTLSVRSKAPAELPYDFEEIKPFIDDYKLGIVCGIDRKGHYVAFDLTIQPHILIAGETGSGKSTQLRSILTTLIKTKKPSELELYLGDCKKSEFHLFRKVEHVKCVYSSSSDIRSMLDQVKRELDERSDLTELFEVGHIDDLPAEHRRPYIVVCIDEFVMLRKDEDIMDILTEIVAIGRTLGVFAILSMQRPSAKVLDTTIRANLTVSMGFKLRDITESKIVNTPNAHMIEHSGYFIMNSNKVYGLQAPYLRMEKAKELLNPFMVSKRQPKKVEPATEILTEKDVFLDAID
ncbi:FtsK/SpoIIIE domain-containing protein [Lederbergia citri]|uniref:AAA family ATPase n=1 Tax=Lederbergia citri TaxID=2833580 RepID=A0A942YEI0_9BACI|nr:FtsK/SpoIIIE domain-containing protein [Lederbergia citri]MBS4193472.1 AAA family ATPase [Lederbergia citri]